MGLSTTIDVTDKFNSGSFLNFYIQDLSGWDTCVVQIVTPSGAVSFGTTNDDGSVLGVLPPVNLIPVNFIPVQGVSLETGMASTTTSVSSNYKFEKIGQFLIVAGIGVTVVKMIFNLSKIS